MIPKIVHYCWFGGKEMPRVVSKCIRSWERHLPGYEIVCWSEKNFDIHCCEYVNEAYQEKKWAFVSDYARLRILYEHGGIYLDTDQEVYKSLDAFLSNGVFLGFEDDTRVAAGIIGATQEHQLIGALKMQYEGTKFRVGPEMCDYTTIVEKISNELQKNYGAKLINGNQKLADGVTLYEKSFFYPKDYETGKIYRTSNTYAIHHYNASWQGWQYRLRMRLRRVLGSNITDGMYSLYKSAKILIGRK